MPSAGVWHPSKKYWCTLCHEIGRVICLQKQVYGDILYQWSGSGSFPTSTWFRWPHNTVCSQGGVIKEWIEDETVKIKTVQVPVMNFAYNQFMKAFYCFDQGQARSPTVRLKKQVTIKVLHFCLMQAWVTCRPCWIQFPRKVVQLL